MSDVTTRLNIIKGDTSGTNALAVANEEINQLRKSALGLDVNSKKAFDSMESGAKDALKQVSSLIKASETLGAKQLKAEKLSAKAIEDGSEKSWREAERAVRAYEKALADTERAQTKLAQETGQAQDDAIAKAQRLADTYQEQTQTAGDFSTGLGALGSVSSAVGGQGVAEGLRLGGDVAGALEYIPKLGDAVKTIGIEALTSSGTIGYMATAALTAVPALGGVGAGLVAISIAALPLVAIGLGLALVFGEINKQSELAKEASERWATWTEGVVDVQNEIETLLGEGSTAELEQNLANANKEFEVTNEKIVALKEALDAGEISEETYTARVLELQKANVSAELSAILYEGAVYSQEFRNIKAAEATKLLTDELTKQNTEATSLKTTIDGLTQQENDLVSSQEQRRKYQAEDLRLKVQETAVLSALQSVYSARKTALDSLYASEDAKATQDTQNAELSKRLLDIQTSATAKIADLQKELVSKQVASNEQLADVETQSQAQAVKRLSDFEAKKKAIEDKFQNAKFEAGVNNDVTALALAQRERKQGKRGASKEFNQAEKEANQASQTRIAQIRTELASFTVAQNEKIKLETDNIATAQANEIKSFNDNEKREALADATRKKRAESYARLEEQLANQRSQLATYYDNIRAQTLKQREDEALNAQLQKIDFKKQAELSALDAVIVKANELKALMDGKTVVSPKPGAPTPSKITAFAEGGIVTKPMMGLVGERGSEAIIPLRKLSAFASGSSKKSTVINTQGMFNGANFGEVLTPNDRKGIYREVERALRQFAEELLTQTE